MENNHTIANRVLYDLIAHGRNHPGSLVAVNAGRGKKIVFDFLEVSVTNPTGFDTNQDFAGTEAWSFDGFNRDPAGTPIDGCSHNARYRLTHWEQRRAQCPPSA